MISDPTCPTCEASNWRSYGLRRYDVASIEAYKGWTRTALRILFEVWVPGRDKFEADFTGCEQCGLLIYQPRPSEADIVAKYRFVGGMGDATPSKDEDPKRTQQRAERVKRVLSPHLPKNITAVLDYGGGDGRLLKAFVDNGVTCHLIDYADRPIPGVTKVGDTEHDITSDTRYSAIVCSHVVEHLPDPKPALAKLGALLSHDGVIYVEVPFEVGGKLPASREPVTHVNFFTVASLSVLLEAAGFTIVSSKLSPYPHPSGHIDMAIGVVARFTGKHNVTWPGAGALRRAQHISKPQKLWLRLQRRVAAWHWAT